MKKALTLVAGAVVIGILVSRYARNRRLYSSTWDQPRTLRYPGPDPAENGHVASASPRADTTVEAESPAPVETSAHVETSVHVDTPAEAEESVHVDTPAEAADETHDEVTQPESHVEAAETVAAAQPSYEPEHLPDQPALYDSELDEWADPGEDFGEPASYPSDWDEAVESWLAQG